MEHQFQHQNSQSQYQAPTGQPPAQIDIPDEENIVPVDLPDTSLHASQPNETGDQEEERKQEDEEYGELPKSLLDNFSLHLAPEALSINGRRGIASKYFDFVAQVPL